jgi:hypothetical protein
MKDEIQIQLDQLDMLENAATENYNNELDYLNKRYADMKADRDQKKCILNMSLNSPVEFDTVEDIQVYNDTLVKPAPAETIP